jgi:hypothetical protein
MAAVLAMALSLSGAQAAWHGGGGGWHGGGGWGWHGGGGWGWGWGPGVAFGLALPPIYYPPPPAYYYPPPAYYRPPYPYGYAPGYYGYGGQSPYYSTYPAYGMSMRLDPNNCGTPDEPKPCSR